MTEGLSRHAQPLPDRPEAGPRERTQPLRVSILGATGSIGTSTLDLIGRDPGRYAVVALTANSNAGKLAELAIGHGAEHAVLADPAGYAELKQRLAGTGIEAAAGESAVAEAATLEADWTMAAIVGAAGLRPSLAALGAGRRLALANKECLVSAGDLFMDRVAASGATLLPVDSEHSAVFQAMLGQDRRAIERIVLTASGGPFRTWSLAQLAEARPEQALKHPNWSMGRKVTIDSATLMNKGLELIEAHHLFSVGLDRLAALIHPQSIVHGLVEYADGSVLAQLSRPDMRTPIALSLAWPERMATPCARLDLARLGSLTFEEPDEARFPALRVTREALSAGAGLPTVLNAANEVAVEAFLGGRIGFLEIVAVVSDVLEVAARSGDASTPRSVDEALALDAAGRSWARERLERGR